MLHTKEGSASLVFCSSILWYCFYRLLLKSKPTFGGEWHCRIVTAVHAVIISLLSYWCGFVQGPWPFTDPGGENTDLQHITCCLSLGYFLFDFGWCLHDGNEGIVMLCHHLISIFGLSLVIFTNEAGTEMIACLFGSELTNPFLQLRYFFKECKVHKTWYGELNDLVFMILFGYLRIGVGSCLLYSYLPQKKPNMIHKLGSIAIYLVGVIFWISILKYAYRKYTKMFKEFFLKDHARTKND